MSKTIVAYAVKKPALLGEGWIVFRGSSLEVVRKHYPKASIAEVAYCHESSELAVIRWME